MRNDISVDMGSAPDRKGNIELCRFGSTALLFLSGTDKPFIVASDYDRHTGNWSSAAYFADFKLAFSAADIDSGTEAQARPRPSRVCEKSVSLQDIVTATGTDIVKRTLRKCIEESLTAARESCDEGLDEMMSAKNEEAELLKEDGNRNEPTDEIDHG